MPAGYGYSDTWYQYTKTFQAWDTAPHFGVDSRLSTEYNGT
jgi:hypothetical protein